MADTARIRSFDRRPLRRRRSHDEDPLLESGGQPAPAQPAVVALQRQVGNAGMQQLLRSGAMRQVGGAELIHRKGCGCASCAGERIQRTPDPQIQRFWGDDEESESDSGGSIWDSVTSAASSAWDSASGAVSDAASSVGNAVSGAASSVGNAVSGAASSVSEASDSEAGGSLWDQASEAASGAWGAIKDVAGGIWDTVAGEDESAEGEEDEGGSWWDDLWDEDEESGDEDEDEDEVDRGPTSGSVDAIKGGKVGMGGGCDLPYGVAHPRWTHPAQRPPRAAGQKPPRAARPYKINANITMVEHKGSEAPVESSFMAFDMPTSFKTGAYFDFGSVTEPGGIGIPGSAFGYSAPTITVDNIKWTIDPPSATISITARVHVWVNWSIRSNDKQDINTGNEDNVTKNNWDYVIRDLSPSTGEGQPTRSLYYSSTVTVKHEMYHANEYIASAKGQIPAMSQWVASQPIELPEDKSSSYLSVINPKVSSLMSQVRDKVEAAVKARYDSGGENRAYADGKGDYNGIIANIEKRAKANNWPKNLVT